MDRENALELIRENRLLEEDELITYEDERISEISSFQSEEELLEDFDRWLENERFYKKVQDNNRWASL